MLSKVGSLKYFDLILVLYAFEWIVGDTCADIDMRLRVFRTLAIV